jgi:MFS transporter, DHA1 family, multidrug resistance protein
MKYLSRCNGIPLPVRLAAINFLCSLALYSSNIFMPLYAQEHEASRFQIGLIVSAWGTAYFVSSFIFGRLSDRRGRLVFIRLGLGLAVAAYLLQIVARDPVLLLAVRALVGFCLGVSSAAMMAYVYEAEGQVGRFASYGSLGWLCGCAVAVAVRHYGALFAVSSGASALAFLLSLSLREDRGRTVKVSAFPLRLIRSNIKVYAPFFLRCLGSYAVWTVFPLFLVELGATRSWVAILDGINMAFQFLLMRYVERFKAGTMLVVGLVASVVVFASYGLATHYLQVIPIEVVVAISWSCLWVGALSFLMRRSVERGTAAGLLYSMTYLSSSLGPLIGGFVSGRWSYRAVMFVGAGITLAGLLLSVVLPDGEPAAPAE